MDWPAFYIPTFICAMVGKPAYAWASAGESSFLHTFALVWVNKYPFPFDRYRGMAIVVADYSIMLLKPCGQQCSQHRWLFV